MVETVDRTILWWRLLIGQCYGGDSEHFVYLTKKFNLL